ncbi:hypothetical protein ASPZODRAFT_62924 [Penicilliopsis zonata CBS 506.65]|uniref:SH3 domain-containing protein n=1 Tax=Penicilliopsis zonata CBS 506.65 TaxID=1073090 RepID=A0A1L9SMR3_9EURO|nr:hypothetical protein ASPZODRAFT_62924 [Penicilliopsis zonata CBS 506.65]OJJ48515.1 hypothetical protein ASPZODRAFT_62924 [Penicilliopsis zonata CBS 506.65]
MAPAAPQLPTRFPCWCRAVYSWGGETKRDLGFVEGDLIECLNAGDGQWWMGRLRRDRRMVGLFPSNFVEVLSEDFVPVSVSTSPMVKATASPIGNPTFAPKKQKTVFRKPFQAHKEALSPAGELAARSATATTTTTVTPSSIPLTPPRAGSLPRRVRPLRSRTTAVKQENQPISRRSSRSQPPLSRAVSPQPSPRTSPQPPSHIAPRTAMSPATSPAPIPAHLSPSPAPPSPRMRSPVRLSPGPPSPAPAVPSHALSPSRPTSREVSPSQPSAREESPPPPPPPPHRVAVTRQPSRKSRSPAPLDMNDRYVTFSRTPSPAARPESRTRTPSPLRDAMEDVMSSLEDMGLPRQGEDNAPPSPPPAFGNPWSPDAYDNMQVARPLQTRRRPVTSQGFNGGRDQDPYEEAQRQRLTTYTPDPYMDGPPQLNNYVQRMESRLRQLQERRASEDVQYGEDDEGGAPPPPPKNVPYRGRNNSIPVQPLPLRGQRSGHNLRDDVLNRSYTNKSTATTSSSGMQSVSTNVTTSTDRTSQSLMSGPSAGGFSATSAGSYARRGANGLTGRPSTAMDLFRSRGFSDVSKTQRPETPLTGISYHSSHNSSRQGASSAIPWSATAANSPGESPGVFGGLSTPKAKKHGFFKKILESAKTGAASARSSISVGQSGGSYSPSKGRLLTDTASSSPFTSPYSSTRDHTRDMGLVSAGAIDWVQVRRDVNRATSPSRNERVERAERCQMMDHPVIYAVEELYDTAEGDESIDGLPIHEPTNFGTSNLTLVDKSARFVNSLPPMTNATSLAQGYICRPYKSDVQRLRAIFTWVSEKIAWDDPVEEEVQIDLQRVVHTRRGSPQEVAHLVREMCAAVGLHAETVHGFLKTPGDLFELDSLARPNHWWNSVLVDGEWRVMDCSLASPTNPRRTQFVTNNSSIAESWYFLARPMEICYTHVPLYPEEQHICPPIPPDVLLALPTVCPPYFKNTVQFPDYDTSIIRIEGLELLQIRVLVPPDVECAAEVEAPAFARDADGDFFESGDIVRKRALVQPDWICGQKRYTIKAVLPGDEGQGVLKVYTGKKGLMHSNRDIPHPLALALPIIHTGENPPYEFVQRHPTPHAQRHDLYIMQPQCARLAINNTFVFAVRQHPSSSMAATTTTTIGARRDSSTSGRVSPSMFIRPSSALSMVSSSAGGSTVSTVSNEFSASTSAISSTRTSSASGREKPAKLAIQSPSGKILRLNRKADHMIGTASAGGGATELSAADAPADGSVWETVIKIGERGVWRGLVLADRVARWCVFCEWECF